MDNVQAITFPESKKVTQMKMKLVLKSRQARDFASFPTGKVIYEIIKINLLQDVVLTAHQSEMIQPFLCHCGTKSVLYSFQLAK